MCIAPQTHLVVDVVVDNLLGDIGRQRLQPLAFVFEVDDSRFKEALTITSEYCEKGSVDFYSPSGPE